MACKAPYTLATKLNSTRNNEIQHESRGKSRPCRFGSVHTGDRVDRIGDKVIQVVADLAPVSATVKLSPVCTRLNAEDEVKLWTF